MDSVAEQIVSKRESDSDKIKKYLYLIGGPALGILLAIFSRVSAQFGFIIGIAAAASILGGIYFGLNSGVEYEYSVVNGEIDIDKIIAQKKRQSMISFSATAFTAFGKYSDDTPAADETAVTVMAIGDTDLDMYYGDFSTDSLGKCRLIFTPNSKILNGIKQYLRAPLRSGIAVSEDKDENQENDEIGINEEKNEVKEEDSTKLTEEKDEVLL